MATLAREGGHSFEIRNWATRVTHKVPSKQPLQELAALYVWVRENIRYRNDPHGLEWVQSPKRTLIELAGDCDDMAVLLGAGAIALGRPIRFEIVGPAPGRYQHTYVQAQVPDGRWVTLDPVLEPPATGEARTDLGKFGYRAQGHHKRFNADGAEMSLSGPTTPEDRLLWQTVPYFPQVPPTSGYASPADAGRSGPPNTAYRSARAPGPTIAGPPSTSGVQPYRGNLGHYTTVDRPYPGRVALGDNGELVVWDEALGGWGFLKKIGRAVKGAVKVVTKIPGINIAASLIPGGSAALSIAKTAARMIPGGKKRRTVSRIRKRDVDRIKRQVFAKGRGRGRGRAIAARVARELERKKKRRVARGRGRKKRSKVVRRKRRRVTTRARRRPTRRPRVVRRKPRVVRRKKRKGPSKAQLRRRKRRSAIAAQKRPHPALRSKFPPDARQLWDPNTKQFRIFIPVAGGLSGVCPPGWSRAMPGSPGAIPAGQAWQRHRSGMGQSPLSISLSLLGEWKEGVHRHTITLPSGERLHTSFDGWFNNHPVLGAVNQAASAIAARAAVDAVAAHIRSRGDKRPPGRSVAAVLAFQKTDPDAAHGGRPGGLNPDGLWGQNARTAAAHYLGVSVASLPPILPVFARGVLSWSPPPAIVVSQPMPTPTAPIVRAPAPVPAPTPIRAPTAPTPIIRTQAPAVVISKPPAPTRIITKPPVRVSAPVVVAAPRRKLETLRRDLPPPAVIVTGPTAPPLPPKLAPAVRYPPRVITMPKAAPATVPAPVVVDAFQVPAQLPAMPGPVAPIPIAPPVNTTAAPPGQYPQGAVYTDSSGTPRVSGYTQVASEHNNPGMDPVGMKPPAGQQVATVPGPSGVYAPASVVHVGASNNNWVVWAVGLYALTRKRKRAA